MSAIGLLNEADLHGLVDGHIDASRRADVLRRLAASPADRARVEAWQEQSDLIRSAFFGIDREPIPVTLRLVAPPALHCVPATEPALVEEAAPRQVPLRQRVFSTLVGTLLIAAGIGGGWMLIQPIDDRSQIIDVSVNPQNGDGVTGTIPVTNAARSTRPVMPLATFTIPDLSSVGFIFTHAETLQTDPSALVFHYRKNASEQINVSVSRNPDAHPGTTPIRNGQAFSWRTGDKVFSVIGTIRPERLRSIAAMLQASER